MPKIARHPIDKHIGKRLRTMRIERGLSQSRLGAVLGISFQQVQKYELGNNRISVSTLLAVAQFFQVPPQAFFEGAVGPNLNEVASDLGDERIISYARTLEGTKVINTLLSIENPSVRRKIVALLSTLAAQ